MDRIRLFRKSDAKACAKFVELAIRVADGLPKKDIDFLVQTETTACYQAKRTKNNFRLVYEKDGKILGVIGLKKDELNPLYVDPRHQQIGIGTALVKKLEEIAKEKKIKRLWLDANPDAEKFYQRLGYKTIKRKLIKGTRIPVLEMEKRL